MIKTKEDNTNLRKAICMVAIANLCYFFVEFFFAIRIHSVSLFADSIDFLEDSSVNFLIFFALSWSLVVRSRIGMVLAAIILIPGLATLWAVWQQIIFQKLPEPGFLSLIGFGALVVNSSCALLLAEFRFHKGSLVRAAFLSARNDAAANIAIILTGFLTSFYPSIWPDIIVGLAIAALNAGAAKEVYQKAREEQKLSKGVA
jgi:Co/Zn/Cd efflux system component